VEEQKVNPSKPPIGLVKQSGDEGKVRMWKIYRSLRVSLATGVRGGGANNRKGTSVYTLYECRKRKRINIKRENVQTTYQGQDFERAKTYPEKGGKVGGKKQADGQVP